MAGQAAYQRDELYHRLLEAARDYSQSDWEKRRGAAVDYLFELAEYVTMQTGSEAAIAPLLDVIPFVANPIESSLFGERRAVGTPPSDIVLARASVAIDVFMMLGNSAEVSAQLVARQLINGRVRLPDEGDDVRGWKRLLVWRDRLASLKEPLEHYQLYANILREVERLPKSKIRELAVDGRLWNMRAWSNT
ncbi:MAG: hypothetical protein KDJ47_09560 [Hyphomicrobiaceae bacterium]|nr:hypothetical protein [Hyphomicrobiaceae bacterium]